MKSLKNVNGSILKGSFENFGFIFSEDERQFKESLSYLLKGGQSLEIELRHIKNMMSCLSYSDAELTEDVFWLTPITQINFDNLARIIYTIYTNTESSEMSYNTQIYIEHSPILWALTERGKTVSGQLVLNFEKIN